MCLEKLDCHDTGSSSERVAVLPARETVVLPPTDHNPPGYLESSCCPCGPVAVSQYLSRLLLVFGAVGVLPSGAVSISFRALGGCCIITATKGREKARRSTVKLIDMIQRSIDKILQSSNHRACGSEKAILRDIDRFGQVLANWAQVALNI